MKVKVRKVNDNKKTKEKVAENKIKGKDEYSILNYFKDKNNITVIISIFSAVAAIVAFFTNVCGTIETTRILNFWKFNNSYVIQNNTNFLINSLDNVFFILIVSFLEWILLSLKDIYYPIKEFNAYKNLLIFKNKANIFKLNKQIVETKILKNENRYDIESIKKIKIEIIDTSNQIKKAFIYVIKEDILRYRIYVSFVYAVTGLLSFIYIYINTYIVEVSILFALTTILLLGLTSSFDLIIYIKCFKDMNYKNLDKMIEHSKFIIKEIMNLNNLGLKLILKNSKLIYACIVTIVAFVSMYIGMIIIPLDSKNINHYITSIDNTEYIIIYQDGTQYCLEEVEREGKKLTVFTNRQRIVNSDDMTYIGYNFDNIIRKGIE